jgi:RNA polymerase sigma-70 factor (ECF subfamily)
MFGRHRDRLWAVAVRTLGDPEEAADALQDAMIAAFQRADSFRGDSAVTTWLYRIVVNAALDRMRRRAARPTTACRDEEALDALATGGQALADPSDLSDTAIDVRAALQQLVPEQQAALVLVDMLGYSVVDAAQVLGVPEGTVKSRAARGRARLLPRLEHLRARRRRSSEQARRHHDPPRPTRSRALTPTPGFPLCVCSLLARLPGYDQSLNPQAGRRSAWSWLHPRQRADTMAPAKPLGHPDGHRLRRFHRMYVTGPPDVRPGLARWDHYLA